ncbi:MAG: protein-L-isoaspartate O-methyltransferase [Elusimicrobia bacterium GWC2_51_8]|nr:MAG: protein-L-isoaspartate O-methyltransferase [Elusimicrobia bacterium GWA2_51_34]OGR59931.1 MAG: protein-L-isoaspartate O-methyltransferase [Elusimicrobia bacterium GWC2_51_8]OGR84595.1 MAG: protein-L-isoaspartate O-methyltransferase [Elusimicrobia bacterium GWF2_52_66]
MIHHILGPKFEEFQTFLRSKMVDDQIKRRGIKHAGVLTAMGSVKRHLFAPEDLRTRAYEDYPLPISSGQTMSQPYIVALMMELLGIKAGAKVLEIGTGSGYQAACLSELGCETYSVEIFPGLSKSAGLTLERLGYPAINLKTGDGRAGWPERAPYDGIITACAAISAPRELLNQLKPGARLVIPIGPEEAQTLKVFERTAEGFKETGTTRVRFVPMLAAYGDAGREK